MVCCAFCLLFATSTDDAVAVVVVVVGGGVVSFWYSIDSCLLDDDHLQYGPSPIDDGPENKERKGRHPSRKPACDAIFSFSTSHRYSSRKG